jgi:hypothetical protein
MPPPGGLDLASEAQAIADGQVEQVGELAESMTPEALVDIASSVKAQAVRISAAATGTRYTDRVQAIGEVSARDRAELLGVAPYAVPYVQRFLTNAQLVGMILFCGSLCTMGAAAFAELKEEKARQREEAKSQRESGLASGSRGASSPAATYQPPPTNKSAESGERNGSPAMSAAPGVAGGGLPETRLR